MYRTHFLQGETNLNKEAQQTIEQVVDTVYQKVHKKINLNECEVLVSINPQKVLDEDLFLGLSYDDTAIYLFADAEAIHKTLLKDKNAVTKNVTEHCYRSLYTTARTKHIGLDANCGLLEEVICEGLSEVFVTENMSAKPKNRFTQLSEKKTKRLWKKIQTEHSGAEPNIEKWFWGNKQEGIPPFTACTVGYAIANAYLSPFKKKSYEALTTPAKHIAKHQNCY